MAELIKHGAITDAPIYWEDNNMVGIAVEVEIPEIEWEDIDHETLGSVAVFGTPSRALQKLTGSMKLQFPEPTVYQSMLNPTKVHQWQVHQKVDAYGSDGLDADASYTLVTTMGLRFSKVKADTIKLNDIQMIEAEFTLFRLRQTILASGDQLFSVDVMGNQVQVGNEDIWPN